MRQFVRKCPLVIEFYIHFLNTFLVQALYMLSILFFSGGETAQCYSTSIKIAKKKLLIVHQRGLTGFETTFSSIIFRYWATLVEPSRNVMDIFNSIRIILLYIQLLEIQLCFAESELNRQAHTKTTSRAVNSSRAEISTRTRSNVRDPESSISSVEIGFLFT